MIKRLILTIWMGLAIWSVPALAVTAGSQQSVRQVTLEVGNLSCGMCKYTVEKALKQVEGVKSATVDIDQGIAVVTFDPDQVDAEALASAVSNAGYPASVRTD